MYSSVESSTLGDLGHDAIARISLDSPVIKIIVFNGGWLVSTGSNIPDYNMGYVGYNQQEDPEEDLFKIVRQLNGAKTPGLIYTAEDFGTSKKLSGKLGLVHEGQMPLMMRFARPEAYNEGVSTN